MAGERTAVGGQLERYISGASRFCSILVFVLGGHLRIIWEVKRGFLLDKGVICCTVYAVKVLNWSRKLGVAKSTGCLVTMLKLLGTCGRRALWVGRRGKESCKA